tara:strand:+ start:2156 stop:2293 length:138 start_codon:yes stop_codon:yes gene_type:complete
MAAEIATISLRATGLPIPLSHFFEEAKSKAFSKRSSRERLSLLSQ